MLLDDFLAHSKPCVDALVTRLVRFRGRGYRLNLYQFEQERPRRYELTDDHLFIRASVEYSNPQLTVEEVQGILAARLLEVCGNYFATEGVRTPDRHDVDALREALSNPPRSTALAFLLNTDDVEPDRYSMNPLKRSILDSGQSAFPALSVKVDDLRIDPRFMEKYAGSLISPEEAEAIERHRGRCDTYLDMVDAVKYEYLRDLSDVFGVDLCLPSLRMPLTVLGQETPDAFLHYVIKESHYDRDAVRRIYRCMGRSMKNRTTLLTVPHSHEGYGSKRAARGRLYFDGKRLTRIKMSYRTRPLYPNAIDPQDVSPAIANDAFELPGAAFTDYAYRDTPSSPQFILYSLASPEEAVLWHGIGAFGASKLVRSYTTTHQACETQTLFRALQERYGVAMTVPLQLNLVPKHMWVHPTYDNIDASIGSVSDPMDLAKMGMRLDVLPSDAYTRA
jgi:hypothetical protein